MHATTDQIRSLVENRLTAVDAEIEELSSALKGIDGEPSSASRSRRRSPQRVRRGERSSQFLAVLKSNPSAPLAAIAQEMGISRSQARGIAQRLGNEGLVKPVKDGFKLRKKAKKGSA